MSPSMPKAFSRIAQSLKPNGTNGSTDALSEKGKAARRNELRRLEKQEKEERRSYEQAEIEKRWRIEDESARASESEETRARYGELVEAHDLSTIAEIGEMSVGQEVEFRARIFTQRRVSSKLDFILFRDQTHSIQGVLAHTTPHMVRWAQRLHPESLVYVTGTLKKPVEPVRSATHSDVEVDIYSIHLVNSANNLGWTNYEPPDSMHTRLSARVLDIRHPSNQALLRIRSMITRQFRDVLDDQGFIEIHTPKLQPAATESGSSVFKVNYFGRTAFLAQSPQLAKQQAIAADLGRVFEIGPVFRAENSNTHRHLTEYTGLDLEMALEHSYAELIVVVDKVLKAIISAAQSMPEIHVVRQRWPSEDVVFLEETPVIPFSEGIQMLRDDGRDVAMEDLSTRDEIRLGELIKEKYNTDLYILDKFPANARPFYTHKAEDPQWTNSFDIFLRGQEICTGGQRIHDAALLRESMRAAKIYENEMEEYLAAFDLGPPPHGGAGIGLERILLLLLELGDIRHASLFHRDPKSLPAKAPSLPHPEADTTKHCHEEPPVEKLIANYGDASNTSWLDERFQIWRHHSGAAVGYAMQNKKFVMITGDPLCDQSQYEEVIAAFIDYIYSTLERIPVWMLVSDTVQHILGRNHKWRTLSCTEEQRVDPDNRIEPSKHDLNRIEREGIDIDEVHPDDDFMLRTDKAIEEWKAARQGKKQVHLTEVRPWVDQEHRRYFAAQRDGEVFGMVVLAQLARRNGWQLKWALDFPAAPNGTIEVLVENAMSCVNGPVTFGVGASEKLTRGAYLHGVRAKFLANTYEVVVKSLRLDRKSAFREKFGTLGEQVYICYPRRGVGVQDLKQIVKFFED
ncbi:uncharacterized protein BCR38DRAFT_484440 [Pseudomassariella vexata]|uniref:Probable aspartate--tRNA ligase, cytoplasmic n=1 Tax=Pseudomassariella vexata TaxID=1141098 RepID=A0A1Y2E283_9PEZI|nr:uncharacterized protein BCR38DRAFT_484440 [Pseudomassariella vexata]ORY64965.1 hypothetical protein BCR38DRAFT_484440 [Pseudomassariella vexata]